jgi:hypothetical protein
VVCKYVSVVLYGLPPFWRSSILVGFGVFDLESIIHGAVPVGDRNQLFMVREEKVFAVFIIRVVQGLFATAAQVYESGAEYPFHFLLFLLLGCCFASAFSFSFGFGLSILREESLIFAT